MSGSGQGQLVDLVHATATVAAACTVSATNLAFGTAGTLASNVDATNSLGLQCSSGTPYDVGLNAGNGTGATASVRKMTATGATINYTLYSNSARTTVWGNTGGTDTVNGAGTGSSQNFTVYGRVPSQATPGGNLQRHDCCHGGQLRKGSDGLAASEKCA